ncbi:hypothetical protein AcW1_003504 [Taiwanofungus camphoratus]|nr:hypothetical protein AcV5_002033 [Antrodia cinnamomea]KAI0941686.1 hypothetical protein AcW1_003504 [Antrodia cinnamomea]KAI0943825.1 hypothetical protein AcV7_001810 [Antrodia cinnamomea]
MYPHIFQTITLLFIFASLVCSTPMPAPAPEPIDQNIAHAIALNNNIGCSGPQGCIGANVTNGSTETLATSGALSRSGATNALAVVVALAAGSLPVVSALV